jgi:hypothetical protein
MTAPVASVTSSNKTMLLGMKYAKMEHYRITAMSSSGSCQSDDFTVMTGALPTGLQKPTITTTNAAALAGGFLVTGQYTMNAGSGSPAYILDADGDYVWAYGGVGNQLTGARMSYDGQYMWINNANVPNSNAVVWRVSMDGMTADNYSSKFTGMNHQMAILPDETVAYYAYNNTNGCDEIK